MLAKRVIPTVLVRGKTAYKGPGFGTACTRSVGSGMAICRTHARRGVDELLILDIGATPEGRGPDLDLVRELSAEVFIPITVGGGVRTLEDIDALLRAGADKVAIGAEGQNGHELIERAALHFGRQALVQIIDVDDPLWTFNEWAGELVLQSSSRDGTLNGYDLRWLEYMNERPFDGPLIISCGCSGPADMLAAVRAGADGCAAGALFQFTDCTPRDCSWYLQNAGIEVRL